MRPETHTPRRTPGSTRALVGFLLLAVLGGCGRNAQGPDHRGTPARLSLCDSEASSADLAVDGGAPCLDRVMGPAPLVVHVGQRGTAARAKVAWTFAGDSLSSPGAARVFVRPGRYTVTLVVRYPSGREGQTTGEVTVLPPETRLTGPAMCRVGATARLTVQNPLPYPLTWQADSGQIGGDSTSASFVAAGRPGTAHLQAVYDVEGRLFPLNHDVVVYRQFVILKADDAGRQSPRWQEYLDHLCDAGVPNAAGLVGRSLQQAPTAWVQYLLKVQSTGLVEFFHHGWDHATGDSLEGVHSARTLYEFQGTSYAHQKAHLDSTLDLAARLGFVVTTFGAPFNRVDAITVRALNDTPLLRTVLYQPAGARQLLLRRTANVETQAGEPDYHYFVSQYAANLDRDCLVLQVHPNAFTDAAFAEMWKIVHLLMTRESTFITPEAYRLLHSGAAAPAVAVRQAAASGG